MANKKNSNIDQIKHNYKLIISAVVFISFGVVLILLSYHSNQRHPGNILAFLFLSFGSLCVFGAAYNLVNDLFLKRNFAKQMRRSLDERLERISLDESIHGFGLHSIEYPYSKEALLKKIASAKDVLMVAIRNAEFFRYYCPELRDGILKNDLQLTILMLSPTSTAIAPLTSRFYRATREQLSESIKEVVNVFIKREIYDKLGESKGNLELRFFNEIPSYSAYVFDDEEVWFVPYYFRPQKRPIPVFVLKGREILRQNEIYKDIKELQKAMSSRHDLRQEV